MTLNGKLPAFCIPQPRGSTNRCFLHARDQAVARNTRPSTNFTDYPTYQVLTQVMISWRQWFSEL